MHHAELAGIDYLRDLARQLESTPHGRRGALVTRAAGFMSCSEQTLRNRLRKVGFSPDRKLRRDAGDSRVSDGEVKAVAAIMISSQRANGKMLLPVGDAIEIAIANAVLSVRVSTETMLRRMRQLSCHPQQLARPEPHVTMRSLHPNHVWQLDASICVIYYLRNGRVGVMDERNFNARKPANLAKVSNLRVMRYALTCHTSGSTFARYYMAAGENQHTLFEFLMEAMHARPDGVMHGVPWMLVWDAGAANLAHGIQGLLTALAIRHYVHIPGNPRAKGQIESTHNVIERKFEGRLTFTTIDSVEQLNDHLDTWLCSFNGADVHSRTGHTRWGVWQTIRPEQLRLCPPVELCRELLFAKPATRTVKGNLTISFALKGYGRRSIPLPRCRTCASATRSPSRPTRTACPTCSSATSTSTAQRATSNATRSRWTCTTSRSTRPCSASATHRTPTPRSSTRARRSTRWPTASARRLTLSRQRPRAASRSTAPSIPSRTAASAPPRCRPLWNVVAPSCTCYRRCRSN